MKKKVSLISTILAVLISVVLYVLHVPPSIRTTLPVGTLPTGSLSLITEPTAGIAPVLDLINGATSSVDLVMYEFKDKDVGDALIAAKDRGVEVRVLVDHGYYGVPDGMNDSSFAYLQSHGVDIKWTPANFALTHQKTLIIDNARALIMTFNFTPQYYETSRDFGVLDSDSADVTAIENTFTNDWKNGNTPAPLGTDLVWSPGSETDMLLAINSATKTLDVYNEEMADQKVTDALIRAAGRGIVVRVVMTYSTGNKQVFNQLIKGGVQLKTFGGGKHTLYIHAKMIFVDGTEAFLGSENFSENSLQKNRELGLFITDKDVLASLKETFEGDYSAARVYLEK